MKHYKEKQVFSSDTKDQQSEPKFDSRQTFEGHEFIPSDLPQTSLSGETLKEEQVETLFKPRRGRWKWKLGAVLMTGLVSWQLADSWISAFTEGDYLGLAWTSLLTGLSAVGAGVLLRELWKMRRLRNQGEVQVQAAKLYCDNDYGNAKKFCESLTGSLAQSGVENLGVKKWKEKCNDTHSDKDVLDIYQGYVLSPIDQKVKRAIAKYSSEAAVMVAVSPLAAADMMLVAWRNISLINRISKEYGVELGYWSRVQLLRMTLLNMAAAGGTELAIDAGMDLISMDLTAKLSTRAAQGVGVGLLTARLGIKAAELMRPIQFNEDSSLRLRDIRDQVLVSVKHRLQNTTQK